ncbi:MAG: hypothetical protein Q7U34_02705 [Anaerolineales bacterium]|nr:hypothetical protein [Anaerolineales bacterium]MDO9349308.1 hypothetical protein [Anaerolineales bacterium]MDP3185773.1 hypothetical protein [Anaerolineales bacterium]
MSTLYVEPEQRTKDVLYLVQSAVESEIARLELALEVARRRLMPFEQKYGVTTEHFIAEMSAEDLDGKDDEYVHWAGEYQLMQKLQEKLQHLMEIKFE